VPPDPPLDDDSAEMVALVADDPTRVVNLVEFGVPVFYADATTPRQPFECTMPWGPCRPEQVSPVPIPPGARPNDGSDGAMVVIDESQRVSFEYWQAEPLPDGSWRASWASMNSLDSDGTGSGGSGSGISRLAGMVRLDEIADPDRPLRHALAVSSKFTCAGEFRAPATQTDGRAAPPCLPEGARLQLDPEIDVDAIPDISPGEALIARALQDYGAFVVDSGEAALAFLFERAPDANGDFPGERPADAGFEWDYFGLRQIPWASLRVLAPES
jgi:hypothetical protein